MLDRSAWNMVRLRRSSELRGAFDRPTSNTSFFPPWSAQCQEDDQPRARLMGATTELAGVAREYHDAELQTLRQFAKLLQGWCVDPPTTTPQRLTSPGLARSWAFYCRPHFGPDDSNQTGDCLGPGHFSGLGRRAPSATITPCQRCRRQRHRGKTRAVRRRGSVADTLHR